MGTSSSRSRRQSARELLSTRRRLAFSGARGRQASRSGRDRLSFGPRRPLALDATVVSCLHADGRPFPGATAGRRSTFARAERLKRATYPELCASAVLKLKTVACTTGGAWNTTALEVLAEAADGRARSEVPVLRGAARGAWCQRWTCMLSVSVQSSLAATLVNDGASLLDGSEQKQPLSLDVWLDARGDPPAAAASPAAPDPTAVALFSAPPVPLVPGSPPAAAASSCAARLS